MIAFEMVPASAGQGFEGGKAGLCDLDILRDGAAGYAQGSNDLPIRRFERYAAPEWGEAAVRQLQARCGSARLAVLPDGLAVGLASTAPSMRRKALRWAPASSTATTTGRPISRALLSAPSMAVCA
jgi:hypothetical protein